MRVRVWWMGRREDANAVQMEGVPEIEVKSNEAEGRFAKLALTGAPPGGDQLRVVIFESEWPVLRSRIDAAFNGEDPNTGTFAGTTYREVRTRLCTNPRCSIDYYNAERYSLCPSCRT